MSFDVEIAKEKLTKGKEIRYCKFCGKGFIAYRISGALYCSFSCIGKDRRKLGRIRREEELRKMLEEE
jgi:hypothetical protein